VLGGERFAQMLGGGVVALGIEQARQQLLGRLARIEVDLLLFLTRQHQPGLQLQ